MIASRTTIIDASVAVKWVCAEEGSDRAAALLDGQALAAPGFWLVEAANALWRRAQRGELGSGEADERIAMLAEAPVRALDIADWVPDALKMACELHHPVYDCLYLAAAVRCRAQLVTADRRFHAVVNRHPSFGPRVALL